MGYSVEPWLIVMRSPSYIVRNILPLSPLTTLLEPTLGGVCLPHLHTRAPFHAIHTTCIQTRVHMLHQSRQSRVNIIRVNIISHANVWMQHHLPQLDATDHIGLLTFSAVDRVHCA